MNLLNRSWLHRAYILHKWALTLTPTLIRSRIERPCGHFGEVFSNIGVRRGCSSSAVGWWIPCIFAPKNEKGQTCMLRVSFKSSVPDKYFSPQALSHSKPLECPSLPTILVRIRAMIRFPCFVPIFLILELITGEIKA